MLSPARWTTAFVPIDAMSSSPAIGSHWTSPLEGAFYAFPKSPDADDLVFCRRMLDKGLVIVPGAAFGAPGYFRISYAVDDEILDRGLAILMAES